jgi:hypothetical protein
VKARSFDVERDLKKREKVEESFGPLEKKWSSRLSLSAGQNRARPISRWDDKTDRRRKRETAQKDESLRGKQTHSLSKNEREMRRGRERVGE